MMMSRLFAAILAALLIAPVAATDAELAKVAHTSLICPPDEARRRIKRIQEMGFDEVLLVSPLGVLEHIERARDFL